MNARGRPRSSRFFSAVVFVIMSVAILVCQEHAASRQPVLTSQNSGTKNGLIAVSAANARVVWACGKNGTFTVTTDGGQTWKAGVVPGAEKLEFRDVEAVSDKVAYLLSVGPQAGDFRIYHTSNAGATWTMQFQNQTPKAFYDCFAFWKSSSRALAHSDSVDGIFPDLRTDDGKNWRDISRNLPPALPSEGSFASSGTCVATQGRQNAWIATGGGSESRVLATRDGGETWNVYPTPLKSAQGAGAFTIAFRDAENGILGGGALAPGNSDPAVAAVSRDGGKTWKLTSHPPVTGAIYGLAYAGKLCGNSHCGYTVVVTANDGGAAWSPDEGTTWYALPDVSGYWGVAFANAQAGWLVGTNGRILKVSF
jgi:photosystem II stability/assembly factor-like uncharacterized protein